MILFQPVTKEPSQMQIATINNGGYFSFTMYKLYHFFLLKTFHPSLEPSVKFCFNLTMSDSAMTCKKSLPSSRETISSGIQVGSAGVVHDPSAITVSPQWPWWLRETPVVPPPISHELDSSTSVKSIWGGNPDLSLWRLLFWKLRIKAFSNALLF